MCIIPRFRAHAKLTHEHTLTADTYIGHDKFSRLRFDPRNSPNPQRPCPLYSSFFCVVSYTPLGTLSAMRVFFRQIPWTTEQTHQKHKKTRTLFSRTTPGAWDRRSFFACLTRLYDINKLCCYTELLAVSMSVFFSLLLGSVGWLERSVSVCGCRSKPSFSSHQRLPFGHSQWLEHCGKVKHNRTHTFICLFICECVRVLGKYGLLVALSVCCCIQ